MAPRNFHHSAFADASDLARRKGSQRISVCIPTLNEAPTIGGIVETIRRHLMEETALVKEILVIDSGSDDGTRDIAATAARLLLDDPAAESVAEIIAEHRVLRPQQGRQQQTDKPLFHAPQHKRARRNGHRKLGLTPAEL